MRGWIRNYLLISFEFNPSSSPTYHFLEVRLNHSLTFTNKEAYLFYLFILRYWGLNSVPTPWTTPSAFFCEWFFQDRIYGTICPGWLQTMILLISASWVVRITGMSHWCLAGGLPLKWNITPNLFQLLEAASLRESVSLPNTTQHKVLF
jgi:hypothetical protein